VILEQRHYQRLLAFRTGLRRFLRWSADQAATVGVTPAQHQLLLAIRGHPDPAGPTIRDVAGCLLVRHHSAVELVDRAVAAGLVERRQDRDDLRAVRLRPTADGADRLARLTAVHQGQLRRLAPQLEALWDGLDTAVDARQPGPFPPDDRPPRGAVGAGRGRPRVTGVAGQPQGPAAVRLSELATRSWGA
jgi:DNA-binding MarR family transcriptional regulator